MYQKKFQSSLTTKEQEEILEIKNSIHSEPELSHKEFRTTQKIIDYLNQLGGFEILDLGLETGVVAVYHGAGGPGLTIGLRADIDAINQIEESDVAIKSQYHGIMHGCGHDFHTAVLLSIACIVSKNPDFSGDIVFIFQPAEETTTGARYLESKGLFKKIHFDLILGLHNRPEAETGQIIIKKGPLMAAKSNFKIQIKGVSGHGSMPHKCIDPIVCASNLVTTLQSVVSRNIDPIDSCVLSIDYIHGGSLEHLVVDEVELRGTVRCLSRESYDRSRNRIEEIVSTNAKLYECDSKFEYELNIPLLSNDNNVDLARQSAINVVGEENVISTVPTLASEDFAVYGEYAPTFFYWIGSRPKKMPVYSWHNSKFITDDNAIFIGAQVLYENIKLALETKN